MPGNYPDFRPPVARLVMLGTPNRPPRLAKWFGRFRTYRWAFGSCGRFLANPEDYAQLPPIPVPFTVVAGTFGPVGRFSPFGRFHPGAGLFSTNGRCQRGSGSFGFFMGFLGSFF